MSVKTAFDARNSIEAHIVCNLLQAHGIEAWVFGGYLEGGAGEIQVGGVASVSVNDEDWPAARELVARYESGELDIDN